MAVKQTETLIPEAHSKLVVFRDHFGHEHKVVVPTHIATEDPLRPLPVGPVEIRSFDAQLENIAKMMRDREQAFLKHCLDHPEHYFHPSVWSHPDHPRNNGIAEPNFDAFEKAVQKDCTDCG